MLFSEYIKSNHTKFLDSIDSIETVALGSIVNDTRILYVKINGTFYNVGFFETVERTIRLCGQLIGIDHWLDDCNIFIQNVRNIGKIGLVELINDNLIRLINIQDQFIENDLHWTKCKFELTVSL